MIIPVYKLQCSRVGFQGWLVLVGGEVVVSPPATLNIPGKERGGFVHTYIQQAASNL